VPTNDRAGYWPPHLSTPRADASSEDLLLPFCCRLPLVASWWFVQCCRRLPPAASLWVMAGDRKQKGDRPRPSKHRATGNSQSTLHLSYYILCMVHGVCTIVEGSRENHTVLNMSARQARAAQGLFRWPPQYRSSEENVGVASRAFSFTLPSGCQELHS
jgi:hypothetical protein